MFPGIRDGTFVHGQPLGVHHRELVSRRIPRLFDRASCAWQLIPFGSSPVGGCEKEEEGRKEENEGEKNCGITIRVGGKASADHPFSKASVVAVPHDLRSITPLLAFGREKQGGIVAEDQSHLRPTSLSAACCHGMRRQIRSLCTHDVLCCAELPLFLQDQDRASRSDGGCGIQSLSFNRDKVSLSIVSSGYSPPFPLSPDSQSGTCTSRARYMYFWL